MRAPCLPGPRLCSAGGIDDVYPAEHRALFDRIAAQGCLVSESPVGIGPKRGTFPAAIASSPACRWGWWSRPSSASGLADHARLAGEQAGRVFAVPGSPSTSRQGNNDLIARALP